VGGSVRQAEQVSAPKALKIGWFWLAAIIAW